MSLSLGGAIFSRTSEKQENCNTFHTKTVFWEPTPSKTRTGSLHAHPRGVRNPRPGKSRKSLSAALGAFLGRSWSFFGRSLLLLGASCGAGGLRQASGVDFRCHVGSILDHFGCFIKLCLGCIVRSVFRLFSMLFFLLFQVFWAARETRPKSENRHTLRTKTCFFKVRARARAGARETT